VKQCLVKQCSKTVFNMTRGVINFYEVTVDGSTSFRKAVFMSQKAISFVGVTFTGDVDFYGARLSGQASFGGSVFNGYRFPEGLSFVEISPMGFDRIGHECRRLLLPGSKFFEYAGEWYWDDKQYLQAIQSFRNAKIEYEREGKYDAAGDMYVKEKKCIRKSSPRKRFLYWVWQVTCNYGESWVQFLLCMALIVILFAFLYKQFSLSANIDSSMDALYFSVVTFATLGLGDILPCGFWGKLSVIFEVFLGYLMFGFLLALVARKITRN